MAVTNIPNVQNWTVTPQNGQSGYFDLMNTWLGQSTLVIASLQSVITAQNLANAEINTLASQAENNAIIATGLANYQGEYSTSTTYSKGQSTSVGTLYYTSKVDGNSDHAVTDINYWVANPINNKYDRGNILGTVSQTSGVPTGAIIESGSNANGTYTKFADGTMICNKNITIYPTPLNKDYITSSQTFPISFISAPNTTISIRAVLGVGNIMDSGMVFTNGIIATSTTTSAGVTGYTYRYAILQNIAIAVIAIGRWF